MTPCVLVSKSVKLIALRCCLLGIALSSKGRMQCLMRTPLPPLPGLTASCPFQFDAKHELKQTPSPDEAQCKRPQQRNTSDHRCIEQRQFLNFKKSAPGRQTEEND